MKKAKLDKNFVDPPVKGGLDLKVALAKGNFIEAEEILAGFETLKSERVAKRWEMRYLAPDERAIFFIRVFAPNALLLRIIMNNAKRNVDDSEGNEIPRRGTS